MRTSFLSFVLYLCLLLRAWCMLGMGVVDPVQECKPRCTVIVLIHGTMLPVPSLSGLKNLWKCKVRRHRSLYQQYLDALKRHRYNLQPSGFEGLESVNLPSSYDEASRIQKFVSLYEKAFASHLMFAGSDLKFYTFGWDARLSAWYRQRAGCALYKGLIQELESLKETYGHQQVNLLILAHSHGGNVALYLGKAEELYKKNLVVNTLMLFGTPIQPETDYLVQSSVFKAIYNVYSPEDFLQVADVFSTKKFSSRRLFKPSKQLPVLPKSLKQICIYAQLVAPRHTELWLFGNDRYWLYQWRIYRKRFPLYPFPVALFTPEILEQVNNLSFNCHHITCNLVVSDQKKEVLTDHFDRLFSMH